MMIGEEARGRRLKHLINKRVAGLNAAFTRSRERSLYISRHPEHISMAEGIFRVVVFRVYGAPWKNTWGFFFY
jgi:hypothetical protein